MPSIVRLGDMSTGHGCFPARPNDSASPNVYCNNIPVHRVGDHWVEHCCVVCHEGNQATGSPNVFANNRPVARIGDTITCGDFNAIGSPNVFANG
jgi:uncharacterized Zn-binding protein involved in type VI secretion